MGLKVVHLQKPDHETLKRWTVLVSLLAAECTKLNMSIEETIAFLAYQLDILQQIKDKVDRSRN